VRGYKEEGTITTPFDMTVLNDLDRFHLALDVVARVPGLRRDGGGDKAPGTPEAEAARCARMAVQAADLAARCRERLAAHDDYIREHGEDMPEIRSWRWRAGSA